MLTPDKVECLNLLKKMHAVMSEIDRIEKDKTNLHQKYEYASEKAIKEKLHEQFVKHGIHFTADSTNPRVVGAALLVDVPYSFIDIATGERLSGTFIGSGHNRDEKGLYAGITGAIKYLLTSNFLIPTGDDPENDDRSPTRQNVTAQQRQTRAAPPPPKLADKGTMEKIGALSKAMEFTGPEKVKMLKKFDVSDAKKITQDQATKILDYLETAFRDYTKS